MIRKHLLQIDGFRNLFCRIPRLRLPAPIVRYLLYDITVDDDDDDVDDDGGDGDQVDNDNGDAPSDHHL